jgi:hypothetical protein
MAPSATNKQPWRIVRDGAAWHFYLRRTKGYGKGSALFTVLRIADLQRVDLGIAIRHFELVARTWTLGKLGSARSRPHAPRYGRGVRRDVGRRVVAPRVDRRHSAVGLPQPIRCEPRATMSSAGH